MRVGCCWEWTKGGSIPRSADFIVCSAVRFAPIGGPAQRGKLRRHWIRSGETGPKKLKNPAGAKFDAPLFVTQTFGHQAQVADIQLTFAPLADGPPPACRRSLRYLPRRSADLSIAQYRGTLGSTSRLHRSIPPERFASRLNPFDAMIPMAIALRTP